MTDYLPITFTYEQPKNCAFCTKATLRGIKEFDESGGPIERPACEACLTKLLEEYKHYLSGRIETIRGEPL